MSTLTGVSVGVMIGLLGITAHVRNTPPDLPAPQLRNLRVGLSLVCFSSFTLVGVCIFLRPSGFTPNPGFVLLALAGNLSNAAGLVYSLNGLSSEGMLAGFLTVVGQVL